MLVILKLKLKSSYFATRIDAILGAKKDPSRSDDDETFTKRLAYALPVSNRYKTASAVGTKVLVDFQNTNISHTQGAALMPLGNVAAPANTHLEHESTHRKDTNAQSAYRSKEGSLSKQFPTNEQYPGNALTTRDYRSIPLPPLGLKDDAVLDIVAVVRILWRRQVWVYASLVILVALAGLVCLVMTPRYKAEAQLEILKQDAGVVIPVEGSEANARTQSLDALDFSLTLQTQVAILQSDALALRVIKELNLAETDDFRYDPLIKTAEDRRQMALPIERAPSKRAYVLKRWSKSLKVDSVAGTRLIYVDYTHPDPEMAAQIVNRLLADFVEYNFQIRYKATTKAANWLRGQLVDLKSQVEDSQKHAVALQKNTGIFGSDETHNIIIGRLEQLNAQAAEAQANRFAKQAIYRLAQNGDPELIAGLLGGSSQPSNAVSGTPPVLLISLRQLEADLSGQYAEAASKYGSDYPKLVQLKNRLESVRADIKAEVGKVVERAKKEYMAAEAAESAAKKVFEEQKLIGSEMNKRASDFMNAKQEADSNRELYQRLLQRLNEAGVLAGLRSSDINIVDPAAVPDRPSKPNIPLYLALGALAGMTFGVATAFLCDSMDSRLRDPEEIETSTHVPVLGVIPRGESFTRKGRKDLNADRRFPRNGATPETLRVLLSSQNSPVEEAFRAVRTSLLLSRPDNPGKVFMMTSALPHEGKSFSSLNLASVLAQNGGKVLLVDADLRRGTLSRNLKQSSAFGLSQLLFHDSGERAYQQIEEIPGLTFLAAGSTPPNPAESLGSKKMATLIERWREEFDFVVIDSAPILAVTDAVVLSPSVDGVIVVVRFAVSTRQSIIRAIRVMSDVQADCFGVLVNAMDIRSADYFYYSGSYGYHGYPYGDSGSPQAIQALPASTPEEKSL
jgi:succinoglycan biosynthesis transport protein ExoP